MVDKKAPAKKAARKASTHPKCIDMITAAIASLKERNGSSLSAIKKYIAANYKCDVDKINSHIKLALKSGVANGKLVQTKGAGANGSFKLPKAAAAPKAKKPAPKKKAAAKKSAPKKKPAAKKAKKAAKKPAAKKSAKKPAAKKAKKPAKKAAKKSKKAKK